MHYIILYNEKKINRKSQLISDNATTKFEKQWIVATFHDSKYPSAVSSSPHRFCK